MVPSDPFHIRTIYLRDFISILPGRQFYLAIQKKGSFIAKSVFVIDLVCTEISLDTGLLLYTV